ncbi:hypothetical protein O3G_MSEX014634 [Manduca sexta]|uniref:limulus clotting factor C n=1 Tax=Manduca sexta TaxID=7130 RepID=A0A922CZW5_MANSE|nr:hypothetical protein O3G_MSEX014634 [Manduca sexta]KAG6464632.1 hypothetical protein O3G_MSEX014634 [Manduca sexta]
MCKLKCFLFLCLLTLLQTNLSSGRKCIIDYSIGTCTLLSKCRHLVEEILIAGSPMPLHITQKLQRLSCGYVADQPVVCCELSDDVETTERSSSDTRGLNSNITNNELNWVPEDVNESSRPSTNATNKVDSEENKIQNKPKDTRNSDIQNHPNIGLLPRACGMISDRDRIVGGNRTDLFEMPWMVVLMYQSVRGTELDCGGTLINEWYVLTAAHCVKFLPHGLELKSVILGEYELEHDPDCQVYNEKQICAPKIKNVAVDEAIPHEEYNKELLTNDIALIRLSEPADFSLDSIKPICLPVTPQLQKQILIGKNAVASGWGLTENHIQSRVLLKVSVPIVSKEDCQAAYEGKAVIHDQQLCAGGVAGKDSCGGDSGGPLVYPGRLGPGRVKYIQRGVVSFGTQICGLAGVPGVYTNVANYMDWILDHIRS